MACLNDSKTYSSTCIAVEDHAFEFERPLVSISILHAPLPVPRIKLYVHTRMHGRPESCLHGHPWLRHFLRLVKHMCIG